MIKILLLFFIFFLFMPLQTWDGMQKNATDDETIEQAINRLIAVHEADSTSHLGVGESLQAHKNADVIDHPAFSIVPDKMFGGDIVIKTQFESLEPWTVNGTVTVSSWNGAEFYVEYGAVNTSKIDSAMSGNGEIFYAISDIYFETQFAHNLSYPEFNGWLGFLNNYDFSVDGFGFQIRNSALYAHVRRADTTVDLLISGYNISESHFYSAFFSFADQKVYFKVDGVLVASLSVPAGITWDDDRTPAFGFTLTEENDGFLFVQYLYAWRKILTE